MSNYTQNVFFGPKDSLVSGDPSKKIKGSEVDTELAEISSAIATKEDTANKNQTNGYAGVGSDGLVPNSLLPDASETVQGVVELATTAEVTTGTDTARAVTPAGVKAALDALKTSGNGIVGDLSGLADPGADRVLFWDESADAVTYLTMGTNLSITDTTLSAAATTDASALTSGTIPDARIQSSGVTQHQGALTIAESQITDGSVLARVGGSETITGNWSFNGTLSYGSVEVGFRTLPLTATAGTTATTAIKGKAYKATGAITIPASTFAEGDVFTVANNSASGIALTQGSGLTLRWAGSTTTGSRTLAAYGVATVWFMSATEALVMGDLT